MWQDTDALVKLLGAVTALVAAVGGGAWWSERRKPTAKPPTDTDRVISTLTSEFSQLREQHDQHARDHRDLLIRIDAKLDARRGD